MTELSLKASHPSDPAEAKRVLIEISRTLTTDESGTETLESLLRRLDTSSTPRLTMDFLAESIFSSQSSVEHEILPVGIQNDLQLLTYLVSSNPNKYLKDASRAVRCAAERSTTPPSASSGIVEIISSQLTSEDVEVSDNASHAMVALCKRFPLADQSLRAILSCWSQCEAHRHVDRNHSSTIAVRCASTVIEIANLSDSAMDLVVFLGATDKILGMMKNQADPLTQMSIIDLIEQMATAQPIHRSRARWILSKPVLEPLLEMAGGGSTGDLDPLLGGPALKLLSLIFSKVGHRYHSLIEIDGSQYLLQGFRRALYNFDSAVEMGRLAFVDAVSAFASASSDALALTLDDPFLREKWLSLASVAQPRLKSMILNSIARVIDPTMDKEANEDQSDEVYAPSNALAMRLFRTFGSVNSQDATDILLSLAKSPIVETKLGSYDLMRAVAKRGAGAQLMLSHGDFYDFLINRETEQTKEGKEAKYSIVKAVLESGIHSMLADNVVKNLEKIVEQGPYYVKAIPWEVATE